MSIFNTIQAPVEKSNAQITTENIDVNNTNAILAFYWATLWSFQQIWNSSTGASPIEISNYWGQSDFGSRVQVYGIVQQFITSLKIPASALTPEQQNNATIVDGYLALPSTPVGYVINPDATVSKAE